MQKQPVNRLLAAMALSGQAFVRPRFDPLAPIQEPVVRDRNVCGVRDSFLFAQDGDQAGGGGVKFTPEQQAKVDEILKGRLAEVEAKNAKERDALTAKLKEFEPLAGQLTELQKKIAEAEAEKQTALEQKSLEGKSELEKLQINFDKLQKKLKEDEASFAAKLAEHNKMLETERSGRIEDAKRNWATQVLASGAADGMSEYAINALLSEAQFELDDNRRVKTVMFEGGKHEKPADVAAAFYKARPGFAKPPPGGAGGNRGNGLGGGNGLESHSSIEGLLGAGLAARTGS